ncbi:MAG: PAS domain S-box protein [Magnetococcales bacterium]|nr:PAS domain S-box protein [Magnetococcales bacterium]
MKLTVVKSLLLDPFLRNLALVAIVIALIFPTYEWFRVHPMFQSHLTSLTEDTAFRTANHLIPQLTPHIKTHLTTDTLPAAFIVEMETVIHDFNLEKLKLFSPAGEVVYSSDSKDIGTVNKHDYFHNQVSKGETFSKVVQKQHASMEGRILNQDVAEIYIPIMQEGLFLGAFEFYMDISEPKSDLDNLISQATRDLAALTLGLIIVLFVVLLRASKESARRQIAQADLEESEARFRSIAIAAWDGLIMMDHTGRVVYVNPAAERLFGYDADEMIGALVIDIMIPKRFHSAVREALNKYSKSGHGPMINRTTELIARRKNGTEFPMEISLSPLRRNGQWSSVGIVRDISKRKELEQRLKLGSNVIQHAMEGVLVTNKDSTIEMVNPAFTAITGYSLEEVVGKSPKMLRSGRHDEAFYNGMWKELDKTGKWRGEIWNRRKDGGIYPQLLSISAIRDTNSCITHYVGITSDISQRKVFEDYLQKLAFYDPLTAIPNRMLFHDRLTNELRQAERRDHKIAVFYLDLDHFKPINDTYGHEAGDLLLQQVAKRLTNLLRKEDTIARLGGDEFAAILRCLNEPEKDAIMVAEKIIHAIAEPFHIDKHVCRIGTSVGISFFPGTAISQDELVSQADEAMYQAKKSGRNQYVIYTPSE